MMVYVLLLLQSSKDYYEQALMQELKKNQDLQDYIRHLESRLHPSDQAGTPAEQVLCCQQILTVNMAAFCQHSFNVCCVLKG